MGHASRAATGAVVALLLAVAAAGPARGDDDARVWLMAMFDAMRSSAYEGTLVYAHGGELEAMDLVHAYVDGEEYERVNVRNGEPFEVIRMGDTVTCVWPASKRVLVDERPGDLLAPRPPRGLEELPEHYQARTDGYSRVAGRRARVIRIEGADQYRYGYRMWIDRKTKLLLRSDMVGRDSTVYERLMFTNITPLQSVEPERFERSLEGLEYAEHGEAGDGGSELEDPEWRVEDLPPGFALVSHRSEAMPPHNRAVQHSVYTDGLASVSVFVEPPETDSMPLEGMSRMGAVHAYGRVVDGYQVTVIGEVPAATVRRVADAVVRDDA